MKKLIYLLMLIILTSFASANIQNNTIWEHYSVDNNANGDFYSRTGSATGTSYSTSSKLGSHSIDMADGADYFESGSITMSEMDSWCLNIWWTPDASIGASNYWYIFSVGTGASDRHGSFSNGDVGNAPLIFYVNNGAFSNAGNYSLYSTTTDVWNTGSWYMLTYSYDADIDRFIIAVNGSIELELTGANLEMSNLGNSVITYNTYFGDHLANQGYNAKYDDMLIRNTSCSDDDLSLLYNGSSGLNYVNYVSPVTPPTVNKSLENTITFEQTGTSTITSTSYTDVLSGDYNTTANSSNYFGVTFQGETGNQARDLTCRVLVDGTDYGSEVTRSFTANTIGSIYVTTTNISLTNGAHNSTLQCKVNTGGGNGVTISGATLTGHLLYDAQNDTLNTAFLNVNSTFNSATAQELGSVLFTTSTSPDENITIVVDYNAQYDYNSTNEITSYVSINGSTCSQYLRQGTNGAVASVGGDCMLKNAVANGVYNISFYGIGDGTIFSNIHIKEFISTIGETNSTTINNTAISSATATSLKSINIENTGATGDIYVKAGIPHHSNAGTTESNFFVSLNNGASNSTSISRDTSTTNGVTTVQYLFEGVATGNHTINLYGSCANANCDITGGELVAYATNSITEVSNTFTVIANNTYNLAGINTFNVTINGNTFTTTTGTIDIVSNGDETLTINAPNYFETIVTNHDTTTDLQANLTQSYITFNAYDRVTNTQINNFTVNDSIKTITTTNGSATIQLIAGNYTFSFINSVSYYNITNTLEVLPLDNYTYNFTNIHNHKINFLAVENLTGSYLENFTINISSGTFTDSVTGIGNTTTINLSTNANYTSTIDVSGYAIKTATHNSLTGYETNYTYYLFEENSIFARVYDELKNTLITWENITIEIISDAQAENGTTDNGTINFGSLTPDNYIIRYYGDNYNERLYYLTLTDGENENIDLYLLNNTKATNITVTILDEKGDTVANSIVKLLKYYISCNCYQTVEIGQTNFAGQTNLQAQINSELYKFVVEYENTQYLETSPFKITTTTLIFYIALEDLDPTLILRQFQNLAYSLNFNTVTNNFRYTFSDTINAVSSACLNIYRVKTSSETLTNTSCLNSTAGTILIGVTPQNGTTYKAVASAYYDSEYKQVDTLFQSWNAGKTIFNNSMSVLMVIFLILIFSFISVYNPSISAILIAFTLIVTSILGILNVGVTAIMGIIGVIIIVILQNRS